MVEGSGLSRSLDWGSMGVVGEICCGFIGALRGLLGGHLGVNW